jgi:TolA-binding protein
MSKTSTEPPARLRDADATELERRLLTAASREQPSRALSERVAGALGIAMPSAEALAEASKAGAPTAPNAAAASGSLAPWASGALLVAVVGGFLATRPSAPPSWPSAAVAAPSGTPSLVALPVPAPAPSAAEVAPKVAEAARSVPASPVGQRGRSRGVPGDVAEQIALIDAARGALAAGGAERALTTLREYQTRYPKGSFQPEAAAIRIEALVELGRTDEARSAVKRFLVTYGPSPLADRVARLAGLERP